MPKKKTLIDPSTLTLEQLCELARVILEPEEGQEVVIGLMDADALAEYESEDGQPSNVVKLFPSQWIKSEMQAAGQEETALLLEELIDGVHKGEYREIAVVLGKESNDAHVNEVVTVMSSGVTLNPILFVGGLEALKHKILFDDAMYGSFDED